MEPQRQWWCVPASTIPSSCLLHQIAALRSFLQISLHVGGIGSFGTCHYVPADSYFLDQITNRRSPTPIQTFPLPRRATRTRWCGYRAWTVHTYSLVEPPRTARAARAVGLLRTINILLVRTHWIPDRFVPPQFRLFTTCRACTPTARADVMPW